MSKNEKETYNSSLLHYANYLDLEILKKLYVSYCEFKELGKTGDTVAICIYLDLEDSLKKLEKEQREAIIYILIQGHTYRDYQKKYDTYLEKGFKLVEKGLIEIRKILEDEEEIKQYDKTKEEWSYVKSCRYSQEQKRQEEREDEMNV